MLLPDGYDGRRRYPLLMLLHGAGDGWDSWASETRGNIRDTARGLNAIVVMPDAARGFYTDWWNGGRRGGPAWERYFLEELIPLVESRFRVLPGRATTRSRASRWAASAARPWSARMPGYFGAAVPLSGFVSTQRPELGLAFTYVVGVDYERALRAARRLLRRRPQPVQIAENLGHTRMPCSPATASRVPACPRARPR